MITLENKQTSIPKSETEQVTYADLIASLINRPLSKTVDLKSMRRDLRILDKLEQSGETIEFSEDEFKNIVELVEASEWAVKHKDILAFADYVDSLKV